MITKGIHAFKCMHLPKYNTRIVYPDGLLFQTQTSAFSKSLCYVCAINITLYLGIKQSRWWHTFSQWHLIKTEEGKTYLLEDWLKSYFMLNGNLDGFNY